MTGNLLLILSYFLVLLPLGAVESPLYLKGEISGLVHDEKSMSFVFSGRIELSFTNPGPFITSGEHRTTIVQEVRDIRITIQDMAVTDAAQNSIQLEALAKGLVESAAKGPVTFYLMSPSIKLKEEGVITAVSAAWLHPDTASRPVIRRMAIPADTDPKAPPPPVSREASRRIIVPAQPEKKD
jgi:hypothetical protein